MAIDDGVAMPVVGGCKLPYPVTSAGLMWSEWMVMVIRGVMGDD